MAIDLAALGWTDARADAFAPHASEGLVPARVALEHTHIYRVFAAEGEWLARVSGRLRHRATRAWTFPAVGDWVAIEPAADGRRRADSRPCCRAQPVSRRAAGDVTEEQIVAANIDTVFLVSGLDGDFNPRRIERYLVVAWDSGATPVIVLNKADLVDDISGNRRKSARSGGVVDVHPVSCRASGESRRAAAISWSGQTGALLGSSGVGKSSIVNQLIGQELLRTREVRASDSRGRHVSTARQLVLLPGQGCSSIRRECASCSSGRPARRSAGRSRISRTRAADCRFRDCQHGTEPGCAVRAAVDAGESRLPARELPQAPWRAGVSGAAARRARAIEAKRRRHDRRQGAAKRLKDKGRT